MHQLRLTWQHTWPHGGADFMARPDGGYTRVYKRTDTMEPGKIWFWTAANWRSLGVGFAATKREACEAAELAWLNWSAEAGDVAKLSRQVGVAPRHNFAVARGN